MSIPKVKHLDEIARLKKLAKKLSDPNLSKFQASRYKKMYVNMLKSVGNIPAGLPSPNSFKVPEVNIPKIPEVPKLPEIPKIPPIPSLSGITSGTTTGRTL